MTTFFKPKPWKNFEHYQKRIADALYETAFPRYVESCEKRTRDQIILFKRAPISANEACAHLYKYKELFKNIWDAMKAFTDMTDLFDGDPEYIECFNELNRNKVFPIF